ncbi:MAG TPA: poly(R)-hydroxyalkanoic acid synthase subunit PhaE [Candidatus Wallbacteria bacterium]|nr:poly(R)-hydroxyalkanoic acid synthase subunit PhaE [Candidatus Wallbacteria bacterium]
MYNFFGDNDFMKKMYEQWEKMMGDHFEKLVHDENFVSEMAKAMAATMSGKFMSTKMMDETFMAMNLPTRGEMVKALQKLVDVEERLIDLGEKFEDFAKETTDALTAIEQKLGVPAEQLPKSKAKSKKA